MRLPSYILAGIVLPGTIAFAFAQTEQPTAVRVTGIAAHGKFKRALLEISQPQRAKAPLRPVLAAGEKVDGVEVVAIDEARGVVSVKSDGAETTFTVDGAPAPPGAVTFHFRDADLAQYLEVYQQLSGRTVLRSGNVSGTKLSLLVPAGITDAEAVQAMETALRSRELATVAVGERFVCIVRAQDISLVEALPPVAEPGEKSIGPFPPGMLKFAESDVSQVLDIYQELSGRTVLPGPALTGKISVRSQTSLRRDEALWMLEAALQLNGTRIFRDGEKLALAVPFEAKNQAAPEYRSNAGLVAAKDGTEVLAAGMVRFTSAELSQVLGVYASLCGRQVSPIEPGISARISIRTQTPMTRAEAVTALDAAAALSGVEFVPVGDSGITARRRSNNAPSK